MRGVCRGVGSNATPLAEALDDDELGDDYPPDAPVGVDEWGVTTAEQSSPESLDDRARREERPDEEGDRPVVRPFVEGSEAVVDDEAQLVAEADPRERDREDDDAPESAEEAALRLND